MRMRAWTSGCGENMRVPLLALAAAAADHAVPADVTASRDIFDVLHFGARGDGSTNDGPAIGRAYAACAAAGGGTVVFAAGRTFLTGPMQLACNNSVTVLEPGTVVRAVNSTAGWGFGPDCPEPAQGESARQMAPLASMLGWCIFVVNATFGGCATQQC